MTLGKSIFPFHAMAELKHTRSQRTLVRNINMKGSPSNWHKYL